MPDGKIVALDEHDGSYSVRVGGAELMSTRRHASEENLAELACAHTTGISEARILIGGLGFGFTLQAALGVLGPDAIVIVAEILGAVIAWNRDPSLPLAAEAMNDPRVMVLEKDVADVIGESSRAFDSIILDVDNGPDALSTGGNGRLYSTEGLRMSRNALRAGGCLGIWSAAPDAAFERTMAAAGFSVETQRCQARVKAGSWHTIFLGRVK